MHKKCTEEGTIIYTKTQKTQHPPSPYLFIHRMKCKFEFHHKPQQTKHKDLFAIRKLHPYNPERLTDNRTLDTFLHRVRLEIMNEQKKQTEQVR